MPDFSFKMHQIQFRLGLEPRPHLEALITPRPLAGFGGKGKERRKGEERGGGGRDGRKRKEGREGLEGEFAP